ncbi:unnamed protein product [Rhodiola kirilowii]
MEVGRPTGRVGSKQYYIQIFLLYVDKIRTKGISVQLKTKIRSYPLSRCPRPDPSSSLPAGGGNRGNNTSSIVFPTIKKLYFPAALVSVQDRKKEALTALKSDLKAQLDKMVKSMDEDSWMFKGLRSRIHLMSRTCAFLKDQIKSNTKSPIFLPSKSHRAL